MAVKVSFAPEAVKDLTDIYDFIVNKAGETLAFTFVERIRVYCLTLVTFPQHGTRRDSLRPGLRTIGFERRATIAFHIAQDRIVIDRILYTGRDLGTQLKR